MRAILLLIGVFLAALWAGIAVAQTPTGSISGRVTDSQREAVFEGARVRIEALNREAVTARDGRYRFSGIAPGAYELTVEYLGASAATKTATVDAGESVSVNFKIGEDVAVLKNVLVVGQAAGQAAALNQQRNADNIQNVLSADAIGDFPDQNAAEALRRVPGLSVANDQGEGRFAIIRGIDPSLNSTTINGVRIPGPEDDSRQVNLDVISSGLLESVVVSKTVTPEMDADAVGGNIELKTATAFDRGNTANFEAGASYNDLRDDTSPKLGASFTRLFNLGDGFENFGVGGSVSYFDRDFGSDNVETDGFPFIEDQNGDELRGLEEAEHRDYSITRERLSVALNFDFLPSENSSLYWRTLYSDFADDEVQLSNVFAFEEGDVQTADADAATFSGAEAQKLTEFREETQQIFSTSVGGEQRNGLYTLDYVVSYAFANEDEPNAIGAEFAGEDFDLGYDLSNREIPRLFGVNADFSDANNYALDEIVIEDNFTEGREVSFALNLQRDILLFNNPGNWKVGVKNRLRAKELNAEADIFDGFGGDFTLADFNPVNPDYPLGDFGPIASRGSVEDFISANRGNFERNDEDSAIDSLAADYDIDENIFAGYGQGQIDFGRLRVLAGVRVERTTFDARGTQVLLDENGDGPAFSPVVEQNSYTDVFPGLHLRYTLTEQLQLRAAYTETIARPSFEAAAPSEAIEIEDGEISAEVGNPQLEPLQSRNIDLGIAYYGSGINVISGNLFYKDIRDFTVVADVAGQPGRFQDFEEAITFLNGDDATLLGAELNYVQQFGFLPSPFDGFLINANLTYTDSEASLPFRDQDTPLPRQSDVVGNLALGYEKYGLSLRIAGAYRDEYFDEIDELDDPRFDRYVDEHFQLDFRGSYRVTENYLVFFNAININDEPFYAFIDETRFASQYEEYGPTFELGFRANY